MLRDITLGQYYPVDSVLHRMDPRTKLFGTLVYIVTLFIADSIWAYGLAALFLAAAIRLSRVPVKFMVRGLKSIVILLLISVSFNLFLTPGTPIFKIGFLQMTWEGLEFAAFMAVRLDLPGAGLHDPDPYDHAQPADRRSGKKPGLYGKDRSPGP